VEKEQEIPAFPVRAELTTLLKETNGARTLDSLEILTVFAYLDRTGVDAGNDAWDHYPKTIDGWVEWIGQRSAT
jgi:hypothetical protein